MADTIFNKPVNEEIKELSEQIDTYSQSQVVPKSGVTLTSNSKVRKWNKLVEIAAELSFSSSTATSFNDLFTVPSGYRPVVNTLITAIDSTNDKPITCTIKTDGTLALYRDYKTAVTVIRVHGMYFTV